MTFILTDALRKAIELHARDSYPRECCGLVVGDAYWACENVAEDPLESFLIHPGVYAKAAATGELRAVVHSHPDGGPEPSESDMASQIETALPWVILPLDANRCHEPTLFGDELGIAPLIGRTFLHGVHDCYSVIRDVHRLGREALALQGIDWPHPPIDLPPKPRDIDWWKDETKDFYRDNYERAGFVEISRQEARAGDVFLAVVPGIHNPHKRLCHGGVLLSGNLILHHLPGRLSRREPIGNWLRAVHMWIRHSSIIED